MKKKSYKTRLNSWLNNLPIQDPVERQMASLLQVLLIGLMALVILATLVLVTDPERSAQEKLNVLINDTVGFLVVALPLGLLRRGYFRASVLIIISVLFITPALAVLVVFDLPNSDGILVQFTLAIILAGLLVSRRALLLVFTLSAIVVYVSAFRENNAAPYLPIVVNFILFNGLIALFIDRFGITLRTALTNASVREDEMQSEIAERKSTLEQIQYQAGILSNINDAIIAANDKDRITAWNPAAESMYGWKADEVIGQSGIDILKTEFKGNTREEVLNILAETGRWRGEVTQVRKDGSRFPVEAASIALRDDLGQITGYVSVNRDITERKQAEYQLVQSEERYRTLVKNSPYCIHEIGLDGNLLSMNPAGLQMMGVENQMDIVGTPYLNAVCAVDKPRIDGLMQEAMHGEVNMFEFIAEAGNKFQSNFVPIYDESGQVMRLMGITEDITERKQAEEEIAHLNERITLATRAALIGVWDWDVVNNRLTWDTQMYSLYGAREEDFGNAYEAWLNGLHPEDQARANEETKQALDGAREYDTEFRVVWPDGNVRYLKADADVIRDAGGEPVRMVGINYDITERKQAEESLRAGEVKFRNIIDASPVPYALNDDEQNITYLNPAFTNIFGYDLNDIPTLADWWPRAYPDPEYRQWVAETWQARLEEAKRTDSPFEPLELNIQCKDGIQRTAIVGAALLTESFADVHLVTLFDVTERKQAEEKLEWQNRSLKVLREIDTSILSADSIENIAHVALEHILRLIKCQRVVVGLFDFETNEWIVFSISGVGDESVPRQTRIPLTSYEYKMMEILSKNQPMLIHDLRILEDPSVPVQRLIKEGLRSQCVLPLFSQGTLIGLLGLSSEAVSYFDEDKVGLGLDVAHQVAIAITQNNLLEKLQGSNAELEKRALEREGLITELTAKNAELERFTYTVSHDLKSPLVTMKGFLGYLEEDMRSGNIDRLKEDTKRIANAVDRMTLLLNDLLELSRVGRFVNESTTLPFEELVHTALELVDGRLKEHDVATQIQPNLPIVYGDRRRLIEVLQNLIDNAAKYTEGQPNPRIEVGYKDAEDEDGYAVFYVKDNGMGIAAEYHELIFGLFNKLNANSEGTGIGLALVKRIIEFHEGRIWIESEVGKGSTFFFTLPTGPSS